MMKRSVFPFSAVLGQERVKNALIWNFVNPRIGGVLICGQKGTAKSTLVRGAEAISGRRIVELPLNVTEDRLVGGIDLEYAVKHGEKRLQRGLLYEADRQILYVDEIDLLSDELMKDLLEAAGEGSCSVEREGISDRYPCDFILIGSMNPEEGGLRPQLLDRFGLYVSVTGEESPLVRCEVVRRRLAFDRDPQAFRAQYAEEDLALARKLRDARERLPQIEVSDHALALAGQLAENANCQGSRGEIAIIETAKAIAALRGASAVNKDAIVEAAKYALPHRMREDAPEGPPQTRESGEKQPERREDPVDPGPQEPQDPQEDQGSGEPEDTQPDRDGDQGGDREEPPASREEQASDASDTQDWEAPEKTDSCGEAFEVGHWLEDSRRSLVQKGSGKRSLVKTNSLQGRYVKSAMGRRGRADIAFDATLRAAAPYQKTRDKRGLALAIEPQDIRTKVREKRTGNFIVFVVDASGSMGVAKRMTAIKGAILSLLNDAYQKRDKVALITFRKDRADLVLGMTRSVDLAAKKLEELATGGKTPLYAGIEAAHWLVKASAKKEKDLLPVVVLVTDGRATVGKVGKPFADEVLAGKAMTADHIKTIVIDAEQDYVKLRLAEKLAREIGADLYHVSELHAGSILTVVNIATAL